MKKIKTWLVLAIAALLALTQIAVYAPKANAEEADSYQFGVTEIYSSYTPGKVLNDSYYYSDDWFRADPAERNDELALLSMQLLSAATDGEADGIGTLFLKKLGFDEVEPVGFSSGDPDGCNFLKAKKKIGDETLIAIVIQSYTFDKETKKDGWTQNFHINGEDVTEGEHYAFRLAVEKSIEKAVDLEGETGKVKYWVMGQSRGGALANLIAAKLPEKLGEANDGIYAYTFEAPAVIDIVEDQSKYTYIHNYICSDDIVTMVPPWGMTLFGVKHELKTEETDAKLNEELEKLGSEARLNLDQDYGKLTPENAVAALTSRIPDRAGYSADRADFFKSMEGEDVTVNYNYQELFMKLMGILFGDGLALDGIADHVTEAAPLAENAIRAYAIESGKYKSSDDPNMYYWAASKSAIEFLKSVSEEGTELPFTESELYAALKLAAPVLLDLENIEITDEPLGVGAILTAVMPAVILVADAKGFMFSHHYDALIGRLKVLAPAPELEKIAIEIPKPAASNSSSRTPGKVASATDALGKDWLEARAYLDTKDKSLQNNKEYYLVVTFSTAGHTVSEDLAVTINGEGPVTKPEISYAEGITEITGVWKFTIGTPKEYAITFTDYDHEGAPEPITVTEGSMLKYEELPKMEDDGSYRFIGWRDDEEHSADTITIKGDIELYGHWHYIIDQVEVNFDIPKAGDVWKMPVLGDPEHYRFEEVTLDDSDYNVVTGKVPSGDLSLSISIMPKKDCEFLIGKEEDADYSGTAMINGEEIFAYIDYNGALSLNYEFTAGETGLGEDGTALGKGASFAVADMALRSYKADKDPKGSQYLPLQLKSSKQTRSAVTLTWNKTAGAKTYVVYGALSGKNKLNRITSVTKASAAVKKAGKKLKAGKYYKFIVVALDKNNKVVSTSKMIHVATKGSKKAGNNKDVTLKIKTGRKFKAVSKATLKKGKSASLQAAGVPQCKSAKVKTILKMRYVSSNQAVATVSAKGVIKAKAKGTCTVFAYTQDGKVRTIKITVK